MGIKIASPKNYHIDIGPETERKEMAEGCRALRIITRRYRTLAVMGGLCGPRSCSHVPAAVDVVNGVRECEEIGIMHK